MASPSAIRDAIERGKREIERDVTSPLRQRLATRYASSWEAVEAELRFIDLVMAQQRGGLWFTPDGRFTEYGMLAFRQQHLERLLTLIEDEYRRTANIALADLSDAQRQAVLTGQQTVNRMALTGSVDAALNVPAYRSIVAATDPASPLRAVLDRYGVDARASIERRLIDGMIQGKGIGDIVEAIRGDIGPGVPTWKLAQISRTEAMRAFRGSLFESYQQLGVREWQWTATLSPRTCLACLAMHGRRFPMTQDFMPSHPQCRCSPTPVVAGIAGPTGDEWFRMQPASWQRQRMGQAYELYRTGQIDLGAFVGRRHSRTWGASVTERSAGDVVRATA